MMSVHVDITVNKRNNHSWGESVQPMGTQGWSVLLPVVLGEASGTDEARVEQRWL